ncbi:phosphodiester glycosidase family protein [Glycomyces buryatensis]|uniref:Phosphodiester glycosidase family protein n=1 Tax=Glycomyces buryatensis TaxID=2570927 RepID=A0A4S8Q3L1_9ACTN|nr:phosphodiester glycosidase family protein [Glycomyces buryatensis]THV38708.1 phosphodiester glycosidase family protein [Glycomyces buryatensis]
MRSSRLSTVIGPVLAVTTSIGLAGCTDSEPDDPITVVPGVTYESYEHDLGGANAKVHLLTVDLSAPGVGVEVLTPEHVADAEPPSDMAERAGAVAVVNGDFFNNSDDEQTGAPTNAPVGPVVVGGEALKAAVPDGQRMGPDRPDSGDVTAIGAIDDLDDFPGITAGGLKNNRSVLGITADGVPTISELELEGRLYTENSTYALDGLNQYALPQNGIGLFTPEWGLEERARAVCGLNDERHGPCSESALEITVSDGLVTAVKDLSGGRSLVSEMLGPDDAVIVARDDRADSLRDVREGDRLSWDYELASPDGTEFATALGGVPIALQGEAVGGLDDKTRAVRTSAGYSENGRYLYLAVLEDDGVSVRELADFMLAVGAHEAVNFDGGGSSLLAAAEDGDDLTVRNDPTDFSGERPVANALAVSFDSAAAEAPDDRPAPDASDSPEAVGRLEGVWEVVATSPGQASTLTFDGEGSGRYVTEGSVVHFWEGTIEPESESTFTIDFLPSDNLYEEYGDDVDIEEWAFTMELELSEDGETLTVAGETEDLTYVRADG